jgi:4a-hydroxytetrahydrobiopterin dehydratase
LPVLPPAQIEAELAATQHWQYLSDEIGVQITFDNFDDAYEFVQKVVEIAKKVDHHPTFFWSYTQLTLTLSTDDEGGVTEKDIAFARLVDLIDVPRAE